MIDVKMKPGFPMSSFKRKRFRMESAGFIFHFNYYTTFSYLQKGHFYIQY